MQSRAIEKIISELSENQYRVHPYKYGQCYIGP